MRFIPIAKFADTKPPDALSWSFITAAKLLIAKRLCSFWPQLVAFALFSVRVALIMGEKLISLWRYIPKPAGLIPIDEASAPSEVNAPAIAIERAVPNPKLTCESEKKSDDIIPSWSIIIPPNLYS